MDELDEVDDSHGNHGVDQIISARDVWLTTFGATFGANLLSCWGCAASPWNCVEGTTGPHFGSLKGIRKTWQFLQDLTYNKTPESKACTVLFER